MRREIQYFLSIISIFCNNRCSFFLAMVLSLVIGIYGQFIQRNRDDEFKFRMTFKDGYDMRESVKATERDISNSVLFMCLLEIFAAGRFVAEVYFNSV